MIKILVDQLMAFRGELRSEASFVSIAVNCAPNRCSVIATSRLVQSLLTALSSRRCRSRDKSANRFLSLVGFVLSTAAAAAQRRRRRDAVGYIRRFLGN